ncbi:MAG: T9SS type A sorting domain-containing protein [Bacteroidota bacterium]
MKNYLLFIGLFCFICTNAQFSEPQIIDDSNDTGATTHIASADFNNNSLTDIVVTRAGNKDQIAIYYNNGSAEFTKEIIEPDLNDPVFVNYGDFNQNGFLDLVVTTQTNGNILLYTQTENGFEDPVLLGTEASFGMSITVHDFDDDGWLDFVVIHQHAIAIYKNNTDNTFTKEALLTTAGSPNILECWDMIKMDVDNDGDMDLVVGETLGVVVYTNDGQGNFTPQTITSPNHNTVTVVQQIDFDNDGLMDLVFLASDSQLHLYQKQTATEVDFIDYDEIAQISSNSVKAMRTLDQNGDDLADVYLAFDGKPRLMLNDNLHDFNQTHILDDNNNLFVQEIHTADLTGNGIDEFIWESAAGTLAYQSNTTLSVTDQQKIALSIYPNPTSNYLNLTTEQEELAEVLIYDMQGKKVYRESLHLPNQIQLAFLPKGNYILKINLKTKTQNFQLIKK